MSLLEERHARGQTGDSSLEIAGVVLTAVEVDRRGDRRRAGDSRVDQVGVLKPDPARREGKRGRGV